jgi:putative component of toxin-antitoxin plasmid stabilization module
MYYIRRGRELIVMLGGGDKSSQRKHIATAKRRAARILED